MNGLIVLALLQTPAPVDAPQGDGAHQPLAPRKAIAGAVGVRSRSTIELADGTQVRLEATYVFPDRARWLESFGEEQERDRRIDYRFGARAFHMKEGGDSSLELHGSERARKLLSFELRRALYVFPHGFDWQASGAQRRCPLPGLGTLVAALDDTGRPRELWCLDPEGRERERVRVLGWSRRRGEDVLAELELERDGAPYGRERIVQFFRDANFVDWHFLPRDRRPSQPGEQPERSHEPIEIPLHSHVVRRVALPPDTGWEAAWKRCDELWKTVQDELAGSDVELAGVRVLELAEDGSPAACRVRISTPEEPYPEGFEALPAGRALSTLLAADQARSRALLRELSARRPRAERSAPAYLRTAPAGASGFQWVQPLHPR